MQGCQICIFFHIIGLILLRITSFFFSSVSENLYIERLLLHMLTDVLSDEFIWAESCWSNEQSHRRSEIRTMILRSERIKPAA